MTNDDDDKISMYSKLRENNNTHTFIVIGIPNWSDDGHWITLYWTWMTWLCFYRETVILSMNLCILEKIIKLFKRV